MRSGRPAGESEHLFFDAVATCGDGVVIADPDGTITYANRAAATMYACAPDQLLGRHGGSLDVPEKEWEASILPALLEGGTWRGYMTQRRKDRSVFKGALTISAIRSEAGEMLGTVRLVRDETDGEQASPGSSTSRRSDFAPKSCFLNQRSCCSTASRRSFEARTRSMSCSWLIFERSSRLTPSSYNIQRRPPRGIPSKRKRSVCSESSCDSSAEGKVNRPRSRRLAYNAKPVRSHSRIFT